LGAEFVGELLSPLGGTGEADLFTVPTADHKSAAGARTLFLQFAQGAGEFHHAGGAAGGIDAAEDPGVAVIAHHDPFIGQVRAADTAFYDVIRLDAVVHFDFETGLHPAAAEVVVERQTPLPVFGSDGAVHALEQGLGVMPG